MGHTLRVAGVPFILQREHVSFDILRPHQRREFLDAPLEIPRTATIEMQRPAPA
jgi:hypothetical protein